MARSSGNTSGNLQNLPIQRMQDRSKRRRRRPRTLDMEMLEDRTLLAVVPSLGTNGILNIALTASNDTATVSEPNASTIQVSDGTTSHNFSLASVKSIAALGNGLSNQSITFTGAVDLKGPLSATGLSSEVLSGLYQVSSANLAASATIDIAAGATLSTRLIAAGGNPLTAHSTGNSGAITLTAPGIQVGNGASILANADSGFTSADVTMSAQDEVTLNLALGLTGFKDAQTSTSIAIGSATIKAKDVNVTALSSTAKTVNLTQNLTDSSSVVMADVTGNGLLDLIVGNYDGPVELYLNNGTSNPFNNVAPIALTNSDPTVGLTVAKLTDNGRNDLIVANQGSPTLLFLNNGSSINPFGGVTPIAITNVNATSVAVGDVIGNGRQDLIVGVMSTNPNSLTPSELFLNNGSATNPFSAAPIPIKGADYVTSLALVKLNGTRPDLVVGQAGLVSNGTTYGEPTRVFLNTGSNSSPFNGTPLNVGGIDLTTTAVAVGDMNGDGRPDLIIGHNGEPTQLFLNSGVASNPFGTATPQNITAAEATTSLSVADVNGDGHADLIVGNSGVPTQLFLNNGSATTPFQGVTGQNITAAGDDTRSVALGNLNGDTRPDLFVGLNGDYPRVYLNNKTAKPFTTVTDTINPEPELAYQADESAVLQFNLAVAAVIAQAETSIVIGSGAIIDANANVNLNAQAITDAENTVIGVFLGGGYADSEPTANVNVLDGASITSGGFFDLEALTQNTVNLFTIVPTDGSPGNIAFSYEKARSASTANLAAGATVMAGAATIEAENSNTFSNKATSLGLQADGAVSAGVSVAISDVVSTATASVRGSVHTTNDATVNASSINTNNTTGAIAAVLSALQDKLDFNQAVTGLAAKLADISFTQKIGNAILAGVGGAPGVAISAGVVVADSTNLATAFVGPLGDINAGGNLTVSATAQDNFKSYAAGGVSEAEAAAIGGGVDDSETNNQANAYIAPGGTVDAGLLLHVVADADIPNPVSLFGIPFAAPPDNTGTNNSNGTDRVTSGYNAGPAASLSVSDWLEQLEKYTTTLLTGRLGSIGTTYSQSEGELGEDGDFGISGDVTIFTVTNAANAYVDAGALVNQHTSSPNQNVEVEADTNIETINLAGQASLLSVPSLFAGAAGGDVGVGGSFEDISYNNTAHAYIDNKAKVSAGGNINVNANTYNYLLNLAQSGANSEALAVNGVLIYFNLKNDTEGWIDAGATASAGGDVGVTAGDTLIDIVGTGGIAVGGDVGVGFSGSYNNLIDTTKAFIGTTSDTTAPLGSVTAGNDLTVHAASSQEIVSVGVSGAFAAGESPPSSTDSSGNAATDGVALPAAVAQQAAVAGKEFGIGISGDVGLNFLAETTEAYISGTGTITAGNALAVTATDTALFIGAAGGAAFGNHVGVGGSVALDNLSTTTEAFTQDATILAGSIDVAATLSALIVAVAAGGAAATETAAVAGSVNLNFLSSQTEAYLGDGTTATSTTGDIAVDAENTLSTVTVAGVLAANAGAVAVGAALDLGIYDPTVLSYISGTAKVTAAGDINVDAFATETIRSIGAALAVALEDGIGASGSAAALDLTDVVEAYIGNGAIVHAMGSLFVDANDNTDMLVIAGSVAGGASAGVGISAGVGLLTRTVKAFVAPFAQVDALGEGADFNDPEGTGITGTGVVIDATFENETLVFAAGAGGGSEASVAASAVVDTETSDTEAYIGQSATVITPASVQVHAEEDTNSITVAGAFAGSLETGVGAAADVQVLNRKVWAHIDPSAGVTAGNNVLISAVAPEKIIAVAAGLGVGGDIAGIAGSATVFTLTNDTEAFIGSGANVSAKGSVSLSALSDRSFIPTAGALAISAGVGGAIGASDSTLVAHDTTLAYIDSTAQITALGIASLAPVDVLIGQKNSSGDEETKPLHGLALTAVSFLSVIPVTVGGAGGFIAGVAGAANVDDLTEVTQAYINQSVTVNATNTGAGATQDVDLLASDQTNIGSGAGAVGVGGVGFGAGADVAVIGKSTAAYIAPFVTVNATEHVTVTAFSSEQVVSTAASASGGGVGIAGAASVYVLTLSTVADIGAHADVEAGGNVVVTANDNTNLIMVAGDLSIGGGVGVGGSVAIPVITKTTLAYVDQNATIEALGKKGATTVDNGVFNVSYSGAATGAPTISSTLQASTMAALTKNRVVTPETESITGVAIVATSTDHVTTVGASGGGGGADGINIAGSAFVPTTTTQAFIGASAHINQAATNNTNANANQSVLVAAGSDYYHLGVAGEVSVSGGVSVDPGAELTIATNHTNAFIDSSALVTARRDIQVMASQGGAIVSYAGGVSVGGDAVAGSVSVFSLNDQTLAYINGSAQVNAGGNVLVAARDDTGSSMVDGTIALGFAAFGVGGSLGLNLISKDTEAYVGAGATVNALAQNTTGMTVFQSGVGSGGSFSTTTANGVAVQAESSEGVFTASASGAGGDFGALAGAVTVNIVGATTKAYLGAGALINQSSSGASASQSVNVAAADTASLSGIDGALAGTSFDFLAGALAGGVDVGIIRNQTSAYIDTGARVHANDNVDVYSLSYKSGDSVAASAAAGGIGIAGAVSVYSIDAGVSSSALASLSAHNSGNSGTTGGYADSQANASSITSQLGGYAQMGLDQSSKLVKQAIGASQSALNNAAPTDQFSSSLDASVAPQGTSAYVGGLAVVTAGGSINVEANELDSIEVVAGAGTLGLATIGGSVALVNVGSLTQAFIDNGAALYAVGNLTVYAGYNLVPLNGGNVASAYGGGLGLVAALGAQVAIVNDTSVQSAHIGETAEFGPAPTSSATGVQILGAGQVTVAAGGTRSLSTSAIGGDFALGLAVGASVAQSNETGASLAYLGDFTQVGQGINTVTSLTISNSVTTQSVAQSTAVAGGIVAGTANVADAENTPTIQSSIGSNSSVLVSQGVTVSAGSQSQASADMEGVHVGGITVGVSIGNATVSPVINAFINDGSQIVSTSGPITVSAVELTTNGALATGSSSGFATAFGGDGANISSTAKAQVSGYVGQYVTLATPGIVTISATGTNIAQTDAKTRSFGLLLHVSAIIASSTASGGDSAYLGIFDVVGTAAKPVGALNVTATGTDQSTASVDLSSGGSFNGSGGSSTSETAPNLTAYVGNNSGVNVTGNITIESTSMTEADASSVGANGGIVDVNESISSAVEQPALNTYIGSTATIVAGGNITVQSLHGAAPVPTSNGNFTPSQVSNNTITFPKSTGLTTGDTVTYLQNGNPPIGGLTSGRVYPVIATSGKTIELGVASSSVNPVDDEIGFSSPDDLQSGDDVVLEEVGFPYPIGGLTLGATYEVYVLSPTTIKLLPAGSPLPTLKSFDPADQVSDNYIDIPGFSDGEAVTYNAPAPLEIQPEQISNSTINLGTDSSGNPNLDSFSNGEQVTYEPIDNATVIGGLKAGNKYYVIAISPNEFQLSTSEHNGVPGAPIALQVPLNATGLQSFSATDQQAIGGLVSGQTYYVINATQYNFQLSAAPNSKKVISLNVSHSNGIHTIGVEGIDFTTLSGQYLSVNLVFPLSTAGASGTYQLVGVGGPTGVLFNSAGGGANAIADGSSGGGVDIGGSLAEADSDPSLDTYLGDSTHLTAGGNIAITATSYANASANGTNVGAGFIAVGQGIANVDISHNDHVNVGNKDVITAQGNFTLQALSNNNVVATTDSDGGGAVEIADAETTVALYYFTSAAVGNDAVITAGSAILVNSQTNTNASNVSANANGGGLGVNSYSNVELDLTVPVPGNPVYAYTETTIETGAALVARNTSILAVASYDLLSSSTSTSAAFGAKGEGDAAANADDTALVTIMPGAMITGTDSVDIEARHDNAEAYSIASSDTAVAAGQSFATATTNVVGPSWFDPTQPDVSEIDAEPGATIVTPDLDVKAIALVDADFISSATGGFAVGHYAYLHGQVLANRVIHWNSDVVSGGGGGNNLLIVNPNGSVDPSSTITPAITATQIIVPDITGSGVTGTINFETNELPRIGVTANSADGLLDGNQATFYYASTPGAIQLLNYSQKDLVVNNISVQGNGNPVPNVGIDVANDTEPGDLFGFKVGGAPSSTLVDIENQSTTGSPNIILSGLINNPIGTTKILNSRGSIVSAGPPAVVLTNVLDVEAANGSIGSSAKPLNADLVQSESGTQTQRPIGVTVLAGGNAYLNFTGLLRDPDFNLATTQFIVPLGSIQAGGDIVASLQESVEEFGSGGSGGNVIVYEYYPALLTTVTDYFRPGFGTGPGGSSDPGFGDSDPTLINSTYDFASLTAGGNITLTGVPATTTINGKSVMPVISVSGFTNINPTPSANGKISASTNGDITLTETEGAMRVGTITGGGDVVLTVLPNDLSGDDMLLYSGSSIRSNEGEVVLLVADNVTVPVGSTINASAYVVINGDYGKSAGVIGSIISISGQIFAPIARINGGVDNDVISLTNVTPGTVTTVTTGGGVNTVNIGSIPPPSPNKGVLNNIQGPLTIKGTGSDTLNADATGNTAAKTGTLTATTLTGLSMASSGITYGGIAKFNIDLGSGGNTFLVSNTASGTDTFLNSGTGKDTINVNATAGPLDVNTGGGTNKNTVNVGSLEPATGGVLNNIQGALTVSGNGHDTMNADATGNYLAKTGALTATTLTGLSMGANGIAYSGLANLNIDLGSGGNTFLVSNTASGTNTFLNSGTGADTVNVNATTGPLTVNTGGGTNKNTVNVGSLEPATGGVLNNIQGALTVIGNGHDTMNADATGNYLPKTGTLTATTLTGLSMGASGITYSGLANLNIDLGSGGNTFLVTNTASGTDTFLNSGTGADTVNVNATTGPLTVNTGGGTNKNTVNVGSLEPATGGVLNNIQGALTVIGNGHDAMNADATGNYLAKTGTLAATTLTGLSMGASGIAYSGLANLNINLGSGGNTFLVTNTAAGTNTFLNSGTGKDTINVNATTGPLTVNTGGGANKNIVNVGSLEPATGGVLNDIQGALTVIGNGHDTMNADATGNTLSKTGTLTATTLTGLSMGSSGIAYSGLSILNIHLGQAPDTFNVQSTPSATTTTITSLATGNTWNVGSLAPTLTGGALAGIQGPVIIAGGGPNTALTDTINFDDSGSTSASEVGLLTDTSLTGLGMGQGGVTFAGQAVLNIKLGNNSTVLDGSITNNLPALTTITGGVANNDRFVSTWANDFNGTLNLSHLGDIDLDVKKQFFGHLNAISPAHIESLVVGGSVNAGSSISAQQIDTLTIGVDLDINLTLPGIVGAPAGTNALGNATIGGSLPKGITLTAASIGSLAVGTNSALAAGRHNLAGIVDVTPGNLGTLTIGPDGSITTTAQVNVAGNLGTMTMEGATPNVGQVMAGVIDVVGTLGSATIAGGTPGLFEAGHVGTIGAYGGFGPIVLRVIEAGIERWLEEDPAGQIFSQPNAAATATTRAKPNYINTQYIYESAGFSSPQISARITNSASDSPDQFDLSTVVFQDGASFNLDRLDAAGVSGIRNVAVEGSLVTTSSAAATAFFLLPSGSPDLSPAGVYLPMDDLASVSVRDYAPNGSIVAAELQGVAFGSFTSTGGAIEPGAQATIADASRLLGPGTTIVPAGSVNGQGTETFRVPFAALPDQQVAFFLDTASGGGTFDPKNMVFTLESDSDGINPATLFPATRGAVTAMIGVDATPQGSLVQSVDLYGDGGSIWSEQFIAQSITSTGPLGDLTVLAPQGLNNVTAPNIFGNISAAGPLFGTIQTTGVRTDPVTGAMSEIPADLGRVYVVQPGGRNAQPYVTATTIGGQGSDSLTGRIISRGNLISSIRSDDGASGLVAAQGNFGAITTFLGTPTRVGGLLVNGGFSGQLVVLGNDFGDLTFHGGLTGGRIAVKGTGGAQSGILGNVIIDRGFYPTGSIGAGSAIVSGGEIGDSSLGTALSVTDTNNGIVAAIGLIRLGNGPLGGSVFNDVGATPGNPDAAAIDALFSDGGQPLGLDLPNKPLGGLAKILEELAALHVDSGNGDLAGP